MENRPYTPQQIAEIEALETLIRDMQDFAAGHSDNTTWVTFILNTPKALKEGAFEGLGAYALEEASLVDPSELDARLAQAEFVSYLGVISALKDLPESLRRTLNDDNWRLMDLMNRMAECAGLYDNLMAATSEEEWTAHTQHVLTYTWNMPGGTQVHAMNMTPDEEVQYINFWVQQGPLMYCSFGVSAGGDYDPEGDPDIERMAWSAWHNALPVLDAMEGPAQEAEAQIEADLLAYEEDE